MFPRFCLRMFVIDISKVTRYKMNIQKSVLYIHIIYIHTYFHLLHWGLPCSLFVCCLFKTLKNLLLFLWDLLCVLMYADAGLSARLPFLCPKGFDMLCFHILSMIWVFKFSFFIYSGAYSLFSCLLFNLYQFTYLLQFAAIF